MIACSKAVRQYGEVKNGHKFKRPPSKKCVARYRAIAHAWLQTYSQHQIEGTLPADMHGAPLPIVANSISQVVPPISHEQDHVSMASIPFWAPGRALI